MINASRAATAPPSRPASSQQPASHRLTDNSANATRCNEICQVPSCRPPEKPEVSMRTRLNWVKYPCEWERPRVADIPHEIDWEKLYAVRRAKGRRELQ
jgi:hypothetical protein